MKGNSEYTGTSYFQIFKCSDDVPVFTAYIQHICMQKKKTPGISLCNNKNFKITKMTCTNN